MAAIARLSEPQRQMLRHLYQTGMVDMTQRAASSTLRSLLKMGLIVPQDSTPSKHRWMLSAAGIALFDEEVLQENRLTDFVVGDPVEWSIFSFRRGVWVHEWQPVIVRRIGHARLVIQLCDGRITACEPDHVRRVRVREPV